ncbi:DUF6262 family protein [Arthrobacter sp. GMC3]|uniref:DUF6262 family protein n=1 Tax=Arthrobacter sp. GMC3 TaxID=2058894 RepID=UPI000CE2BCAB|nr:DUF6262 family protein [Arthrobacter sp. GMC3]
MVGNPENLRAAARNKHDAAQLRAEQGLRQLIRKNEPITFERVAAEAGVSKDFLYRMLDLRTRITELRDHQQTTRHTPSTISTKADIAAESTSNIIRTLTAKLAHERASNRQEIAELQAALSAAHGEILRLKRSLRADPS